jgi:hypothetical protein
MGWRRRRVLWHGRIRPCGDRASEAQPWAIAAVQAQAWSERRRDRVLLAEKLVLRKAGRGESSSGCHLILRILFGPWRSDAVHARVGDELAHVFVGMHHDAEIHAIDGCVAALDFEFAGHVFGVGGEMRLLDGFERSLEPGNDFRLGSDVLLRTLFEIGWHLGASGAEEPEVAEDDVHVDLAGGANSGGGPPCELVGGSGFSESNELVGDVTPFAIVALPEAIEGILSDEFWSGDQGGE